jgi:hypothetical protein
MLSKKRVHLQQFGIIHLLNPDLTYTGNPKRNKIMFMPLHLLETYIRNPSLFFNSFFTLSPRGKHRWQPRSARTYMRVGRWVLPSFYFCQVGLPNCWRPIFLVLPKLDRCQVDLPNCWSCSKTGCTSQSTHNKLLTIMHPRSYLLRVRMEKLPLINDVLVGEIRS